MTGQPHAQAGARLMIVIVNYRTPLLVVDCLASLAPEILTFRSTKVVIVDNCSSDGSAHIIAAAIIERGWSEWTELVRAPINGGFAYGNNLAFLMALSLDTPPDLFWMLNPDTRVYPGALRAFLEFFDRHPTAGIAGGQLFEGDGSPWPFAFRFPSALSEIERGACLGPVTKLLDRHKVPRVMEPRAQPVDWVCGANMVVRRDTLLTARLMDENYFLYFEETDFCLNARRDGWECWYLPTACVMHIAGQSTGLTGSRAKRIPPYWFHARRRYFIVNHGRLYAILADLSWLTGHLLWRVLRRFRTRREDNVPFLLRDFLKGSALFNSTSTSRRVAPPERARREA
ncbi:hypothetical protein FHW96_002604 [Novosphingobium sp. SG751A]|uniref:glycosyltransferase family 2 protein n=1 Tax=Novosphingobium sp. SG751A TaxID=2587000 RepID=UPI0015538DF8|nr:glycosyltransferase family 2 protein [Novosphingobium sp. SG751A]NOW46444.1 hypothetical protein [Novosphingobium sp. SG751A]